MDKRELDNNQLTLAINDLIENIQDTVKRLMSQDTDHIHLAINNLLEVWLEFTRRVLHNTERAAQAQLIYWQDYLLLCKDLNQRLRSHLAAKGSLAEREVILNSFVEKFAFLVWQHVQVVIKSIFAADTEEDGVRLEFYTRQFAEAFKQFNLSNKRTGEFHI